MICDTCGNDLALSKYNFEGPAPETCFKCRASGVQIGFGGFKEQFHNGTKAERRRTTIAEAKAQGLDPEPVHTAAYAFTPSVSQMDTAAKHTDLSEKKLVAPASSKGLRVGNLK